MKRKKRLRRILKGIPRILKGTTRRCATETKEDKFFRKGMIDIVKQKKGQTRHTEVKVEIYK